MIMLETRRLYLRPWEEGDAGSLYKYAKDPEVGPIAGWPVHTSEENSREIIRTVLSAPETYAVVLKETGEPIGSVGLMIGDKSNLQLSETEGEIGYWVGVPYWGQGLIPEAVRELMRRGFRELGLETLWCAYFDGNEKSRRVQEKCGFRYHHTRKDVPCSMIEDVRTEHVTCLTKEQWKKVAIRKMKVEEYALLEDFLYDAIYLPKGVKPLPKEIIQQPKVAAYVKDFGQLGDCCLVAECEGRLIGAVWTRTQVEGYGHLDENTPEFAISVKENFRRQGIGQKLMEEMIHLLKQQGYQKASLSVNKENHVAYSLYQKLGFKVMSKGQDSEEEGGDEFMLLELE